MKKIILVIILLLTLSVGSGCTEYGCQQPCQLKSEGKPNVLPFWCTCPTPIQTSMVPQVTVQISGKVGSWDVDVNNLGTTTTVYSITIDYLDKDVILSSETKDTPLIAPGEKGRVKFFGDGVGAYSIKVKSINLKNGGNVEFSTINQ